MGRKTEIGPDTVLQRKNNILFNKVDGAVVMLSIENGEYNGFNKIGSYIWDLLDQPLKFNELVNRLVDKYDVSKEKCVNETTNFLNSLIEKKLVFIL